jgi:hypothetical protein
MSTGSDPASQHGGAREPTEEEIRAAYEEQIRQVRVEHLLLEHVVSMVNLGMRRTGLAPGTEGERDPEQVRLAIESIRAELPLLDQIAPREVNQIREALSQLQLAFIKIGGQAAAATRAGGPSAGAPAGGEAGSEAAGAAANEPAGERPGEPGREPGDEPPTTAEDPASKRDQPGPAEASGRLWVPGR